MVVVDVEGSVDDVAAVDGGGSGAVVRVASRTFVTSFCPILPVKMSATMTCCLLARQNWRVLRTKQEVAEGLLVIQPALPDGSFQTHIDGLGIDARDGSRGLLRVRGRKRCAESSGIGGVI